MRMLFRDVAFIASLQECGGDRGSKHLQRGAPKPIDGVGIALQLSQKVLHH